MRLSTRMLSRFIKKHQLHNSVPVCLTPLRDVFHIAYVSFSHTTLGCSLGTFIAINKNLHPYERRMILAHEVSHQVLHHPNGLFLYEVGHWWYNQIEMEAQQGAASILVPLKPLLIAATQGFSLRQMQEHFEVPEELVILRLKMARLTF